MSFDGTSTRRDSVYLTPRPSVDHSSFGSPFASELPFPQAPALPTGAPTSQQMLSGCSSTVSMQSRGSATAQAIIESTQALEAELLKLRQSHSDKDREIAALRASIALTAYQDSSTNGQALDDPTACTATDSLADVSKGDEAEADAGYSILSPAFGHLRRAYARSCSLPVVGGVARVGLRTADACVSRATRWASCEQVGKDVDGLLQYVDEQVLTPRLQKARSRSLALCEPALRKVDPLLVRSSALLAGLLSAPRGFAEAFRRRATSPAVWLREVLQGWYGTPPGRLAMEDKLSKSAEAASVTAAVTAAAANGSTGGVISQCTGEEEQTAEASHD